MERGPEVCLVCRARMSEWAKDKEEKAKLIKLLQHHSSKIIIK